MFDSFPVRQPVRYDMQSTPSPCFCFVHDMFTICSFNSPDLDGYQGTRENNVSHCLTEQFTFIRALRWDLDSRQKKSPPNQTKPNWPKHQDCCPLTITFHA
jgi:hypothetical protein